MRRNGVCVAPAIAAVAVCGGCAYTPGGATSARRLIVNVQFAAPVNPHLLYYFLIRNANDPVGKNGPAPVVPPIPGSGSTTGNGFATDASQAGPKPAFTDFVLFNQDQTAPNQNGFALYHVQGGVNGDPNLGVFRPVGVPVLSVAPNGGNVLHFELALSQLNPPIGETNPVPPNPDNSPGTPRYLQLNFVATTDASPNQTSDPNKYVDAFGDQSTLNSGSFNAYITIDAATANTYTDTQQPYGHEPTDDIYPRGNADPEIDLTGWTIQVAGG